MWPGTAFTQENTQKIIMVIIRHESYNKSFNYMLFVKYIALSYKISSHNYGLYSSYTLKQLKVPDKRCNKSKNTKYNRHKSVKSISGGRSNDGLSHDGWFAFGFSSRFSKIPKFIPVKTLMCFLFNFKTFR